jgi:hypothetical protein
LRSTGRPVIAEAYTAVTSSIVARVLSRVVSCGRPVDRKDLRPGHPFYAALHGDTDQAVIADAFTVAR